MAQNYYLLIKQGLKTIEEVPKRLRDEVQKLLDADKEDE